MANRGSSVRYQMESRTGSATVGHRGGAQQTNTKTIGEPPAIKQLEICQLHNCARTGDICASGAFLRAAIAVVQSATSSHCDTPAAFAGAMFQLTCVPCNQPRL